MVLASLLLCLGTHWEGSRDRNRNELVVVTHLVLV